MSRLKSRQKCCQKQCRKQCQEPYQEKSAKPVKQPPEANTKAACEGGFLLLIFAEHFYCVLLLRIFTAYFC
jgi:hypothetical protein